MIGLGPVLYATIATDRPDDSIRAWCRHLDLRESGRHRVDPALAAACGERTIEGRSATWLANPLGECWLQVLDVPNAAAIEPFRRYGWMALEVSVQDPDQLAHRLRDSSFDIIGEPANLEVSDAIRAMQAVGPAGEVLYLTQIKAEVPPFELPRARCPVDRLFIPVMLTDDRELSLAGYQSLADQEGLRFDTRITVINRAHGLDIDHRHAVATLQLRGQCLIEIDQLAGQAAPPAGTLPSGIAWVAFAVEQLPPGSEPYTIAQGPYAGCSAAFARGHAGEIYELIVRPDNRPDERP